MATSTLSQDAVIQLIMRYIGGSRLTPSTKLDVNGLKVTTQANSLEGIAKQLTQYGTTAEQIRTSVLQNPKANTINNAKTNISSFKDKINSL